MNFHEIWNIELIIIINFAATGVLQGTNFGPSLFFSYKVVSVKIRIRFDSFFVFVKVVHRKARKSSFHIEIRC